MKIRHLIGLLGALGFAANLPAQTKTSGTIQCKPGTPQTIEVGDQPGHMFSLSKSMCTWTTPMKIDGTETKSGEDVDSEEIWGMKSTGGGAHWSTMANGDKIFVQFHGVTMLDKDGKPKTSEGHWHYTGGTGTMKGITGQGTYKGTPNADGSMTFAVEGDYKLPGKK
jgi:hypothetical protein